VSRTLKLTIAYDGTAFAGWQMQANQRTVQGVLEEALFPIEHRRLVVQAAGRTDAGVHADGQVVSVSLASAIGCEALKRALNVRLPDDVRVMRIEEAAEGFNARFDARRKTYRYTIYTGAVVPPRIRHFVWHVPAALDVAAMSYAAGLIVGERDFAAFQATGGDVSGSRREVFSSRIAADGPHVTYEVCGTGFLRHMVRNIVGTLVDIGRRRRPPEDMRRVLESRNRANAAPTAPAKGLALEAVEY
jgi:tRNA pseudouridine38-40 synthase